MPRMAKALGLFAYHSVIWLGALACILVWFGVRPSDLQGWHVNHAIWLELAITLFAIGIVSSGYSLYRSIKPIVKNVETTREVAKLERRPESKLKILRALYGPGDQRDIDITESLNSAARDALHIPVDNNLVPHDPAVGTRKRLMVEYSYASGVVECAARLESTPWEAVTLTLPEDSETKKLPRLVQAQLNLDAPGENKLLRDRAFDVCGDLDKLLEKHGARPNPYLIPTGDKEEYARIYNETVQAWDNKFQADYWKNYKDKVIALRHDITLASLTDNDLDNKLLEADSIHLTDHTVKAIDKGLRALAAKIP